MMVKYWSMKMVKRCLMVMVENGSSSVIRVVWRFMM